MDRNTIMRALDERRVVTISYAGQDARTIQPHAILRKPDGTELLEAYQVKGFSEGGIEHGWKNFDLTRVEQVELKNETFELPYQSSGFGTTAMSVNLAIYKKRTPDENPFLLSNTTFNVS